MLKLSRHVYESRRVRWLIVMVVLGVVVLYVANGYTGFMSAEQDTLHPTMANFRQTIETVEVIDSNIRFKATIERNVINNDPNEKFVKHNPDGGVEEFVFNSKTTKNSKTSLSIEDRIRLSSLTTTFATPTHGPQHRAVPGSTSTYPPPAPAQIQPNQSLHSGMVTDRYGVPIQQQPKPQQQQQHGQTSNLGMHELQQQQLNQAISKKIYESQQKQQQFGQILDHGIQESQQQQHQLNQANNQGIYQQQQPQQQQQPHQVLNQAIQESQQQQQQPNQDSNASTYGSRRQQQTFVSPSPDIVPRVRVTDVNCAKLFNSDYAEQKVAQQYQRANLKVPIPDEEYSKLTQDCDKFKKSRQYILQPVSQLEADFPIAFSLVVFKDVEQIERLFRAIYRPQNYYCIHVDVKAKQKVKDAVTSLAGCFDNVFMSSRSVDVQWAWFSVVEPELVCMQDLLKYKKWKYFINLTGQEWPLKTNEDIVRILKVFNGANSMEGTVKRLEFSQIQMCEITQV